MTGRGAESKYLTQDLKWIKSLPVYSLADKNCVLFLWAVSPQLPEALDVIRAWGFEFKTIAFCWSKTHGTDRSLVANLGRWTMGNIELCMLATKGTPKRVRKNIRQLILGSRTQHSRKPLAVRKRIVELMGDLPRVELFARDDGSRDIFNSSPMDGWDTWGHEAKKGLKWKPSKAGDTRMRDLFGEPLGFQKESA